jgi:hypothetical protein
MTVASMTMARARPMPMSFMKLMPAVAKAAKLTARTAAAAGRGDGRA